MLPGVILPDAIVPAAAINDALFKLADPQRLCLRCVEPVEWNLIKRNLVKGNLELPHNPYPVTDASRLLRVADIQHAPRISLNPNGFARGKVALWRHIESTVTRSTVI